MAVSDVPHQLAGQLESGHSVHTDIHTGHSIHSGHDEKHSVSSPTMSTAATLTPSTDTPRHSTFTSFIIVLFNRPSLEFSVNLHRISPPSCRMKNIECLARNKSSL